MLYITAIIKFILMDPSFITSVFLNTLNQISLSSSARQFLKFSAMPLHTINSKHWSCNSGFLHEYLSFSLAFILRDQYTKCLLIKSRCSTIWLFEFGISVGVSVTIRLGPCAMHVNHKDRFSIQTIQLSLRLSIDIVIYIPAREKHFSGSYICSWSHDALLF